MSPVWALGSGGSGQLGIGRLEEKLGVPTPCLYDQDPSSEPISLVGGGNHSLLLFEDGSLYAAGENKDGACGNAHLATLIIFHKLDIVDAANQWVGPIKFIAATWAASIVVTRSNRTFVFGEGQKGELGLGPSITKAMKPTEIKDFPPPGRIVHRLRASMGHVIALLNDSSAWGWGTSRHGQLGQEVSKSSEGCIWAPERLVGLSVVPFSVEDVVCGNGFSYLLGTSSSEEGYRRHGIAFGTDKNKVIAAAPNPLPGHEMWSETSSPCQLTCRSTWSSVYLHNSEGGTVICWGKDARLPLIQKGFPSARSIVTGSEHGAAKLLDGRVIAWGWNEHQNCGKGPGPAKSYTFNVLDTSKDSFPLGCGCATTFLVKAKSEEGISPDWTERPHDIG